MQIGARGARLQQLQKQAQEEKYIFRFGQNGFKTRRCKARIGPTKISTTKQTYQVVCECQNIFPHFCVFLRVEI